MKLLLAVDTLKTLDIILNFMEARSWPKGTEAGVLSVRLKVDTIVYQLEAAGHFDL